jgi:hypothetical protein
MFFLYPLKEILSSLLAHLGGSLVISKGIPPPLSFPFSAKAPTSGALVEVDSTEQFSLSFSDTYLNGVLLVFLDMCDWSVVFPHPSALLELMVTFILSPF